MTLMFFRLAEKAAKISKVTGSTLSMRASLFLMVVLLGKLIFRRGG